MTNLDNLLTILKNGKNKILYKINNESITYKEAYKEVLTLSNNLKKQDNTPIILYGHKSINQFISILACIVAKRSYIPIDKYTPKKRIEEIIKKTNSTLLLKNENIIIKNIESLTTEELNNKYKYKRNIKENINNIAYIIFTSGSTGNSKGVPISYNNLNHFINWTTSLNEFKDCNNLNILSQASFSFDLSVMDIYFSIYKNNTIIALNNNSRNNLSKIYKIIKKERINFLIMTPTFIKMLLIDNNFNEINYPDIKYMFFCGECLEVETAKKIKERFKNIKVINAYGPTEATCFISLTEITNKMLSENYLPVGKIKTSAVKIEIDNNEIILKGKSVFNGYLDLNLSDYYKEKNTNCYKTKDIGLINNNYLYCKGRLDNQIKYQGYRIELEDIENNLLKIKGIKEAVAIAKYKDNTNIVKLIKAFIVPDHNITEHEIKKELSKLIPNYMIPKTIVIIDKIPTNNNGKYDRKKLSTL